MELNYDNCRPPFPKGGDLRALGKPERRQNHCLHLNLGSCRDPIGIASDLLEVDTAICSRDPRDEDARGGKEAGTREIMDQRGRTREG